MGNQILPSRSTPKLLDLFCGAGGAARGYQRAGWHVTGVDIANQPRYVGDRFVRWDALDYLARHWREYDAIHASPPCQVHTHLKNLYRGTDYDARHVDLIEDTRALLEFTGRTYVIENVPGAPLHTTCMLCGAAFGLKVYRHRWFESNVLLLAPPHAPHRDQTPGVGRGVSPRGFISITGTGGFGIPAGWDYAQRAIGIDWMTRAELSQAIPPAYTEYLGRQLLRAVS